MTSGPPEPVDRFPAWVTHDDGCEYLGWRRSWRREDDGTLVFWADYYAPLPADEAPMNYTGRPLVGHFYRTVTEDKIRPRDPAEPAQPGTPRGVE